MKFLLCLLAICSCLEIEEHKRPLIDKDYFEGLKAQDVTSILFNQSTLTSSAIKAMVSLGTYERLQKLTIIDQRLTLPMVQDLARIKAPALKQLLIRLASINDEGFRLLAKAKLLDNLTLLQLATNDLREKAVSQLCSLNMSKLQSLSLSGNNIGVEGYKILKNCHLPKLKKLFLSNTNPTKECLQHFKEWNVTHIERLQMIKNSFSASDLKLLFSMPWSSLELLYLSDSQLNQEVPFGKLPRLKIFHCQSCRIGKMEFELPNLEELIIVNGNINEDQAQNLIKKLRNLKTLQISNNMLRSFSFLRSAPDGLKDLILMGNYIMADVHVQEFKRLTNLQRLSLNDNDLNDASISEVIRYGKFSYLSLQQLAIAQKTLKTLGEIDISSLQTLSLMRCPFANRVVLMGKRQFPKLRQLSLEETLIKDQGFEYISKNWDMPMLESLNLAGCYVTDKALQYLSKMNLKSVKRLEFSECNMTGETFKMFDHNALQSLERLMISEVDLSLDGMRALGRLNLTNIYSIVIVGCQLTDEQMIAFIESPMPRLGVIFLMKNEIGDQFITQLVKKQYKNLTTIGLAFNYVGDEGFRLIVNNFPYVRNFIIGGTTLTDNALKGCKPLFTKYIKQIMFKFSGLGDDFIENLRILTSSMDSLLALDLSNNDIGDKGARALSEIDFPFLRILDLTHNDIADEGFSALFQKKFQSLTMMMMDVMKVNPNLLFRYRDTLQYQISGGQ